MPRGLRRVTDEGPGLSRERRGKAFTYRRADGRPLRAPAQLERIRRLAIPPAYTRVWICPLADGHIQATGRDARGRKQYRYHPRWRSARDQDKFARMRAFAAALPRLRARVADDLRRAVDLRHVPRATVLAVLVRLLDTTLIRVGNEEYARANGSYGLTTLRDRHARITGSRLRFRFRGKSGIAHQVTVDDARVARVVRACQALPGQELFQCEDEHGARHAIGSADVNAYLREAGGAEFTAKDFRTWHASALALRLLLADEATAGGGAWSRRRINAMLAEVAGRLGNTVAVCRKSYVHPRLLELAASGGLPAGLAGAGRARAAAARGLDADERRLLAFLAMPS